VRNALILAALVGLAACKGDTEGAPPELVVEPLALDFGTVGLGAEEAQTVTLTNLGGGSVSVLSVTLTDGDEDVWLVDRNGVSEVLGGETVDLTVTFRPEDTRAYGGQIQVRTDYSEQASWLVSLQGFGGLSEADDDGDGVSVAQGDCDDGNASVYPGAEELCDGIDNDCDGSVPGDETDADYDGYRLCDDDCDDEDSEVNPGATEICDEKDTDCDGINADNDDSDGDGLSVCEGDCDDTEALRSPELAEICDDGLDNDCDGGIDDIDVDQDGHGLCGDTPDCNDNDAAAYPLVVSESGSSDGDGTPADPLDSLDDALAMLDTECRTIYVDAGTYTIGTTWSSGELSIEGLTGDRDDVVLEAPKKGRHFTVTGGELTLVDLTLTGGAAVEDGGSISITNANTVVELRDVALVANSSDNDGGAIAVSNGLLRLKRGCLFDGNTAFDDGGALFVDSGTLTDNEGTTYVSNVGKKGGALYLNGGTINLREAVIRSNAATVEGGGIALSGSPAELNLERNEIALNDATGDGGGLALSGVTADVGAIRNNRIADNTSVKGNGGGIAVVGGTGRVHLVNNTLVGNDAAGEGGGIYLGVGNAAGSTLYNNVLHSSGPNSGLYAVGGADVAYNTVFGTASGMHFAGDVGDGSGAPVDATNSTRSPELVDFSHDGNPDNDDLSLSGGSPEIDDGHPDSVYDDVDGSRNDRGHTGGPEAE
jgi:predicted outer membrane repeat protein